MIYQILGAERTGRQKDMFCEADLKAVLIFYFVSKFQIGGKGGDSRVKYTCSVPLVFYFVAFELLRGDWDPS